MREDWFVIGMSQMWAAYVGDPVDRQSLKFFFLEDRINGGKQKGSVFGFVQLTLADHIAVRSYSSIPLAIAQVT